jgi:large subunit ribosomal protein L16
MSLKKKTLNDKNSINFYRTIKRKPAIQRIIFDLKYDRYFKIQIKNTIQEYNLNKTSLQYGFIGLQTQQTGYILLKQIDMIKKFLYPKTKNLYKRSLLINLCIKPFPTRMLTQKPLQSRIGRGKGDPSMDYWYCKIYKNEILLEFRNFTNKHKCKQLLLLIIKKLPFKTRIITKTDLKYYSNRPFYAGVLKPVYIA